MTPIASSVRTRPCAAAILIAGAMIFLGAVARAEAPRLLYSLVAPRSAEAGSIVQMQAVMLNAGRDAVRVGWPRTLDATVAVDGSRWPVTLQIAEHSPSASTIPREQFALRDYSFRLPTVPTRGTAIIEVSTVDFGPAQAVITVTAATVTKSDRPAVPTQHPLTSLVGVPPAASALQRVFADRISPHEPVYFLYGPNAPAAKFQLSFKYKVFDFRALGKQAVARTVQFAYTQRSLWDINAESSPFYDTSYMPELMYQALAPEPERAGDGFTWLGFQAALKHESNGRSGAMSRSANIVYARPVMAVGALDGWHLLVMPELFTYVDTLEDNPALKDYRGYGRLDLVFGRNDGPSLMTRAWAGQHFNHASIQLDVTLPIRTDLLEFETYLLIQYFNGYGESLLEYTRRSESVRAGISLVR